MSRLLLVVFVVGFGLSWLMMPSQIPAPKAAASTPVRVVETRTRSSQSDSMSSGGEMMTTIERDASGQFHVSADVNGQSTRFLVDTGADAVALTVDEARRLGIYVDTNNFQEISRTASGIGRGMAVELNSVRIAGREIDHVQAFVLEGLEVNLLGQNVLGRLGKLELEGDRMILR